MYEEVPEHLNEILAKTCPKEPTEESVLRSRAPGTMRRRRSSHAAARVDAAQRAAAERCREPVADALARLRGGEAAALAGCAASLRIERWGEGNLTHFNKIR